MLLVDPAVLPAKLEDVQGRPDQGGRARESHDALGGPGGHGPEDAHEQVEEGERLVQAVGQHGQSSTAW